ncbi:unnamed protein product [Calypogeia fissa]
MDGKMCGKEKPESQALDRAWRASLYAILATKRTNRPTNCRPGLKGLCPPSRSFLLIGNTVSADMEQTG